MVLDLTVIELRCFIAVAKQLSYMKAAKSLYISQPAVSRHIISLEKELGTVLLNRNKQYVSLTAAGTRFLSEAEDIESTLGKLKSKHNLERGSIKYSEDSLYWMGYLYRYWCYTYQAKSRSVYKIIQAEELHSLYLPYHTLDPGTAIRRILEAKNLPQERSALDCLKKAYGVQ